MAEHQEMKCSYEEISCLFNKAGCDFKVCPLKTTFVNVKCLFSIHSLNHIPHGGGGGGYLCYLNKNGLLVEGQVIFYFDIKRYPSNTYLLNNG